MDFSGHFWLFIDQVLKFFLIMNPLGAVPFLIALMKDLPENRRKKFILTEAFAALAFMLIFLLSGDRLLATLGVSHTQAKLAGGIYLFIVALRVCFPPSQGGGMAQSFGLKPGQIPFLVPLAVPMLAGPGLLSQIIGMSSEVSSNFYFNAAILAVTAAVATILMLAAVPLSKILCDRTVTLIEKVVGLLLLLMSVGAMTNAIAAFVQEKSIALVVPTAEHVISPIPLMPFDSDQPLGV